MEGLHALGLSQQNLLPVAESWLRLTMLPLLQQGYGDVDEVGELLLRKPEPLAQRLDALREIGRQPVALCNNVQLALLQTA
jgi:hypothetical protein